VAPKSSPVPLTLALLGGLQARLGRHGPPVVLANRKAQALLAYLAMSGTRPRPREELATLLWSDADDADGRNSLRQTLFLIRRALPDAGADYLHVSRATVALDGANVVSDVSDFEQRLAEDTPEGLEAAIALYRDDFLHGFGLDEPGFKEWMTAERERLRGVVRGALATLLARRTDEGRLDRALEIARRLLVLDPLDEPTHRALMRLHARQGQHATALQQYQVCLSVLQRELGVEPDAETRELYRRLRRESAATSTAAVATEELTDSDVPLIGRDEERRRLEDVIVTRACGVVAILGEPGIGKTRLVHELVGIAASVGSRVFLGQCHETERTTPFRPWIEILRASGLVTDSSSIAHMAPVWRAELARLFPELASEAASTVATEQDQLHLFEALSRLIFNAATRGRVTIVVEDLQWADEMSIRFLSFLARRIGDRSIVLAVTARDDERDDVPLLGRLLRELDRERRFLRIPLAPLGPVGTARLVAAIARTGTDDPSLAPLTARVWTVSEGNPFVAVEMARGARTTPGAVPKLPSRVQALIERRLERLSEPAAALMAVTAVIGRGVDFALLVRASGLQDSEVAAGVEELVRRGVLRDIPDGFGFVHERVREVVAHRVPPSERARLRALVDVAAIRDPTLRHAASGFR
jgi:DNA-binding SARP family transcriptional activator